MRGATTPQDAACPGFAVAEGGAPPLRIGWELAQSLGLLAALCILLLCLLPVRPRIPGTPPLSLRKHEILGWSILIAALGHVGLSLAFDRTVLEHLRLTAPLYEWAGICALLASLVLTVPAAGRLRRQLWSRHRDFQALHVAVSCALVALIAVHVVTTNRYLHGPGRGALWLLLSVAALLALLRPRAQHPVGANPRSHQPAGLWAPFKAHSDLRQRCRTGSGPALEVQRAPGAARIAQPPRRSPAARLPAR